MSQLRPLSFVSAGFSLIDGLVATSVVAILAGIAATSASDSRARQLLLGAATELEADLQQAHAWAQVLNAPIRLSFEAAEGGSCYVIHTGPTQDCSCLSPQGAACEAGATPLRTVRFDGPQGLQVSANVRSLTLDPLRGTLSPTGTVKMTAANGAAVHQVINLTGRIRTCSPTPGLAGFKAC